MCHLGWKHAVCSLIAIAPLTCVDAHGSSSPDACEVRYELLELGALVPAGASHASVGNNRGQVTGASALADPGQSTAFLWSCSDGMQDIGASTNLPDTYGVAMNDRAEVIIYASGQWPIINPTAFYWDRQRGAIPLDDSFLPHSITATGLATDGGRVWSLRGGLRPLDLGVITYDARLTDFGRAGGISQDEQGANFRLFTWTRRDGAKDLGAPPAEFVSTEDINNRGDLLVQAYGTLRTSFIVDRRGHLLLLPKPADAVSVNGTAINLQREVVGVILFTGPSPTRELSFLWDSKHGYRNLDELLFGTESVPNARFIPVDINDWGWVTGNVDSNAALAIPVPAHDARFENFGELEGTALCRAFNAIKLHRFLCAAKAPNHGFAGLGESKVSR